MSWQEPAKVEESSCITMFKKKNNLKLDNVNIRYNHKDDTFQITSKDPKLNRDRFSITLNQYSETEENIRKMFIREGIIESDTSIDLPKNIERPQKLDNPKSIYLGVSSKGFVKWNPVEENYAPILFISGNTGNGKTVLMENIMDQILKNNDPDNVYLISNLINRSIHFDYFNEYKNLIDNENVLKTYESVKELFLYLMNVKVNTSNNPTFIFIDEILNNILSYAGEREKQQSQELCDLLNSLFRLSRSKNFYFIVSSQRFSRLYFGDPNAFRLDTHMGSKIIFGNTDERESELMFNANFVRKSRHNGCGRGLVSLYGEPPIVFQGFSKILENDQ